MELNLLKKFMEDEWLPLPPVEKRKDNNVAEYDDCAFYATGRKGPFSNWVLKVNITQNKFRIRLNQAQKFFGYLNTSFSWLIKSAQFGSWLEQELLANNFQLLEQIDCLHFPLNKPIQLNRSQNFEIREVSTPEEMEKALRLDDSYQEFNEVQFHESVQKNLQKLNSPDHLWLLGLVNKTPVAMTSMYSIYHGKAKIAYLSGATTLQEYRNMGIYSALLQYRLHKAIENKAIYAITHAVSDSSSPILQKKGFQKISGLKVYGFY